MMLTGSIKTTCEGQLLSKSCEIAHEATTFLQTCTAAAASHRTPARNLLHYLFLKYEVNMFGYYLNKLKEICIPNPQQNELDRQNSH